MMVVEFYPPLLFLSTNRQHFNISQPARCGSLNHTNLHTHLQYCAFVSCGFTHRNRRTENKMLVKRRLNGRPRYQTEVHGEGGEISTLNVFTHKSGNDKHSDSVETQASAS